MAAGFPRSYWHFSTTYPLSLPGIGDGSVWFIELLLIFVVCYALWRVCAAWWSHTHPRMTPPTRSITSARTHPYPTTGAMLLFIVGLALLTFVVRIWFPQNWWFLPLNQNVGYFPQYISLFIVGLISYRRGWFTRILDALGKQWLWIAVIDLVLFVLLFVLVGIVGLAGGIDSFWADSTGKPWSTRSGKLSCVWRCVPACWSSSAST